MITTIAELKEGIAKAARLVELLEKRVPSWGVSILGPAGARLDADELINTAEEIRSYLGTR